MKIYNTLTKRKEEFVPVRAGKSKNVRVRTNRRTTLSTSETQDR